MEPHSWNGYEPNLGNVGYLQHTGCISVISPQCWILPLLEESKTRWHACQTESLALPAHRRGEYNMHLCEQDHGRLQIV